MLPAVRPCRGTSWHWGIEEKPLSFFLRWSWRQSLVADFIDFASLGNRKDWSISRSPQITTLVIPEHYLICKASWNVERYQMRGVFECINPSQRPEAAKKERYASDFKPPKKQSVNRLRHSNVHNSAQSSPFRS